MITQQYYSCSRLVRNVKDFVKPSEVNTLLYAIRMHDVNLLLPLFKKVSQIEIRKLIKHGGVLSYCYLLCKDGKIVYAGWSSHASRISNHKKHKDFNEVYIYTYKNYRSQAFEEFIIKHFQTKYNVCSWSVKYRKAVLPTLIVANNKQHKNVHYMKKLLFC